MTHSVEDIMTAQDRIRQEFRDGKRKRARLSGHKLTVEWSGETGYESSSTGTCPCGWQESGYNQQVVRDEYWYHITREIARKELDKS